MSKSAITVALVGPDGAGKTTICRKLCAELPWPTTYIYMGINQEACNVMLPTTRLWLWFKKLVGKKTSMGGPPAIRKEHRGGAWRTVKSLLRTCNLLAEEWYRQLVCLLAVFLGRTVVMDRHFVLDYYAHDINPGDHRGLAQRVHGWMLLRYPVPDLIILLDATTASLFQRKQEGTIEALESRRQEYHLLKEKFPDFLVVNAEQPLEKVTQDVREAITAFREQKGVPHALQTTGRARLLPSRELQPNLPLAARQEPRPPGSPMNSQPLSTPYSVPSTIATPRRHSVPAVIVGLNNYTGLQTARVLSESGVPVIATAENLRHFACRTRHCRELIEVPKRAEALIDVLENLGRRFDVPPVLIPCVDRSVLLISKFRERLQPYYRIAAPEHSVLERLADKSQFYELAAKLGFAVPATAYLRTRDDVTEAARKMLFPCILKPAVKTAQWEAIIKTKAFRVESAAELLDIYNRCAAITPLVLQEWIAGEDSDLYTCNAYFDRHSQPLATFVSQKLRQWPVEMGVGSLAQECRNDEVLDLTIRLFQAVGFQGLGYLEVKRDRRSGKHVLIEANVGRPTGRSTMAEAGGVPLHYTMYCDLVNLPLPSNRTQKYGNMKWIYWRRDFRAALHAWRQGKLSLIAWWRSLRGPKSNAIFSWTDPLPFFADVWNTITKRSSSSSLPQRSSSSLPLSSPIPKIVCQHTSESRETFANDLRERPGEGANAVGISRDTAPTPDLQLSQT